MNNNEKICVVIHSKIVDIILNSRMNIERIPDDIEREMYMNILSVLEDTLPKTSCCIKFKKFIGL